MRVDLGSYLLESASPRILKCVFHQHGPEKGYLTLHTPSMFLVWGKGETPPFKFDSQPYSSNSGSQRGVYESEEAMES